MLKRVLKRVYSSRSYVALAVLGFFVLPLISVLAMNWGLIKAIGNPLFVLRLMWDLPYVMGGTAFGYLFITAALFGVNAALATYYFRTSGRAETKGFWAGAIALLGLGCASCGSLLFLPFLGTFLVSGSFFLPFVVAQIPLLGIVIMLWSIYTLAKKIDNPYI